MTDKDKKLKSRSLKVKGEDQNGDTVESKRTSQSCSLSHLQLCLERDDYEVGFSCLFCIFACVFSFLLLWFSAF